MDVSSNSPVDFQRYFAWLCTRSNSLSLCIWLNSVRDLLEQAVRVS
jgi:hypothetical protein